MAFGDGSDGDVVISGNTTIVADMNYNNLTINEGVTLNSNGYKIYVLNTLNVNGTIDRSGLDGENGATRGVGDPGLGALGLVAGTLGGSGKGGDAPYATTGQPGESVDGIANSSGGKGGISTGTNEPAGGTTSTYYEITSLNFEDMFTDLSSKKGGPGGGSGGGQSPFASTPGGGGSGGGVIFISATNFNIGINGTISSNGGVGGHGLDSYGGGGGGGGGGGFIALEYRAYTNLGTITVTGGVGGLGRDYVSFPQRIGKDGTDGLIIYFVGGTISSTNPGRSLRRSTGASIPGGTGCGMGKRRK